MIELPVFNPDIFVLAGFLHIKWYGFMYVLGFLSAWILAKKRIEECDIDLDGLLDYFTYFAMGIVIGGRVGYVLFYNYTFFCRTHGLSLRYGKAVWLFTALWLVVLSPFWLFQ